MLLVDHGEQAQSVPGVEQAHIVEILDHHHIGSIETRFPVAATFDPVGSTATLVVERFRSHGREPQRPTATMLLAAMLSDTVILSSPTTTERDHQVVRYLEELLELDAHDFGIEMFEASSDVGDVAASEIVRRDAKEYEGRAAGGSASPRSRPSGACWRAAPELLAALEQRPRADRLRALRPHGHRHRGQGHRAARGGRHRRRRARLRRAPPSTACSTCRA